MSEELGYKYASRQNCKFDTIFGIHSLEAWIPFQNTYFGNIFLDCGISIDSQDHYGDTALMRAAESDNIDVVSTILDRGANVDLQNENGRTALILAAKENHTNMVAVLVRAGKANPNFQVALKGTDLGILKFWWNNIYP